MANPSVTLAPLAGDGGVRNEQTIATTWATVRSAGSGDSAWPTGPNDYACYAGALGGYYKLIRGYFPFDLTGQIPAGAVITDVTLRLWCVAKASGAGGSIGIVASTQASNTTLATSDFSQVGSTEYATRVNFSTPTTGAYNDFPLNATGIAAANAALGGVFKLALRSSRDIDNSAPTAATESYFQTYFGEQTGTANDPQLVVSYSLARSAADALTFADGSTVDTTISGATTRKRYPTDAVAFIDGAAPYWRAKLQPVLVRAEGANTQVNAGAGYTLPQATITVDSTSGFPSSGTFVISTSWSQEEVTYTGKTGTTFTGCSGGTGTYPDNSLVMATDSENHFPQVVALDLTDTPALLVAYIQKPGHGGSIGAKIVGKKSTNGGLTWGAEYTIRSLVNTSGYTGGGFVIQRLKNGRLLMLWYESQLVGGAVKSYLSYSDDSGDTWSAASAQLTSPFPSGPDVCAVGFDGILDTGSGSDATYGDFYVTCYGNDSATYDNTATYNRLMKVTDGGAAGTWTSVGTINTVAQNDGRGSEEASLTVLDDGTWLSHQRVELLAPTYTTLDRYQCVSSDKGVTWTGHRRILQELANAAIVHQMPEGHLITQGTDYAHGGETITYFSVDRGTTWTNTAAFYRLEASGGTYSIGNGSDFLTLPSTLVPGRRVVNVIGQERSNQAGAQVRFQWYEVPNLPLGYDTLAFTDTVSPHLDAQSRTSADAIAFTDSTAVRLTAQSRTTTDTLALTDTASFTYTFTAAGADTLTLTDSATAQRVFPRDIADTLAWTDASTRTTSTGKTGADTLTWADAATRTTYRLGSGTDALTFADTASGTVSQIPTAPYTLTGSSRARYTAAGSSRRKHTLSGGPTP